jgi:hypothetical protein
MLHLSNGIRESMLHLSNCIQYPGGSVIGRYHIAERHVFEFPQRKFILLIYSGFAKIFTIKLELVVKPLFNYII